MTIEIEISPDVKRALDKRATRLGTDWNTLATTAVTQAAFANGDGHPYPEAIGAEEASDSGSKGDKLLALLEEWRKEDETDDEAELARRDAELELLKRNMNETRALEGRPPAFP